MEISIVTTGCQSHHLFHKKSQIRRRNIQIREKFVKGDVKVIQRLWEAGHPKGFRLPSARQEDARGQHQIVEAGRSLLPERNPLHRVGNVFVESREEPESVLCGQVLSAADPRALHREASGLAAKNLPPFIDRHGKSALRQLMSGAKSADAAAQYRHLWFSHEPLPSSLPGLMHCFGPLY